MIIDIVMNAMKMKYLPALALIFLMLVSSAGRGQTLKLVRTDVDESRSSFVTSTYLFGIDIVAEGVFDCNGVAFELHYNQTDYIKYSGHRVKGFGDNAVPVVIPTTDPASGKGIIHVGVLSGKTLEEGGFDEPTVLHLEFTVSQSAPHGEVLRFTFVNPQAVVVEDSVGMVLDLETEPVLYNIHSFIEVWPGDVDDNGSVNTQDISQILLYLGLGSNTKAMRSFKRPSASTLWVGQRALAWDSTEVTYADCDGNGDVTMTDALVVFLNYNKLHQETKKRDAENIQKAGPVILGGIAGNSENTKLLPVPLPPTDEFIAVSGRVRLPAETEICGVRNGDIFEDSEAAIAYRVDDNNVLEFAAGSMDRSKKSGNGNIIYIVVNENAEGCSLETIGMDGISAGGSVFPIRQISGVQSAGADENVLLNYHSGHLEINAISGEGSLDIYGVNGCRVARFDISGYKGEKIGLNRLCLAAGAYIAVLNTISGSNSLLFIIE